MTYVVTMSRHQFYYSSYFNSTLHKSNDEYLKHSPSTQETNYNRPTIELNKFNSESLYPVTNPKKTSLHTCDVCVRIDYEGLSKEYTWQSYHSLTHCPCEERMAILNNQSS